MVEQRKTMVSEHNSNTLLLRWTIWINERHLEDEICEGLARKGFG